MRNDGFFLQTYSAIHHRLFQGAKFREKLHFPPLWEGRNDIMISFTPPLPTSLRLHESILFFSRLGGALPLPSSASRSYSVVQPQAVQVSLWDDTYLKWGAGGEERMERWMDGWRTGQNHLRLCVCVFVYAYLLKIGIPAHERFSFCNGVFAVRTFVHVRTCVRVCLPVSMCLNVCTSSLP